MGEDPPGGTEGLRRRRARFEQARRRRSCQQLAASQRGFRSGICLRALRQSGIVQTCYPESHHGSSQSTDISPRPLRPARHERPRSRRSSALAGRQTSLNAGGGFAPRMAAAARGNRRADRPHHSLGRWPAWRPTKPASSSSSTRRWQPSTRPEGVMESATRPQSACVEQMEDGAK